MKIRLLFLFCLQFFFASVTQANPAALKTQEQPVTRSNDSIIADAEAKIQQAKYLTGTAYYPEAYDKIWEALSLADSINNAELKLKSYQQLSLLYSIFHDFDKAISCIDSVFCYAKKSKEYSLPSTKINIHYAALLTYRMAGKYTEAMKHVVICEQLMDSTNIPVEKRFYMLSQKAHLNTLTQNYEQAHKILKNISRNPPPEHSYASILYSMWGDWYNNQERYSKALEFYYKSLGVVSEQNTRTALKVELLEKVSQINNKLGNHQTALQEITESKVLGDSLFGSQSTRNRQLFEIKDSYRQAIIENQQIKREQELNHLKTQKEKLKQRLMFSVLLILIITIASVWVVRLMRKNYQMEKKLITERTQTQLELKNKELAVTALQLIEKDKILAEIKQGLRKVQEGKDDASVEQLKSTIQINSANTWDEFEARFVQVNSNFYDSLGQKHPNLSRNELKLCALIKLNLSSKEMAQLLGVSSESINKGRYRLRKKLDLQRDENLFIYINAI